jgi:TolA-binding protein
MFIITPLFLLCTSIALFLVLVVLVLRHKSNFTWQHKTQQSQLEAQEILLNELQSSQNMLNSQLVDITDKYQQQQLENEQVSKQLEHRIKVLQQESIEQKQLIEQIKNQQPQDKLYSRAFKLVELGADIDEVVRECDIPRAEAEMLLSVHKTKISNS